jgi:hypothetical protein
VHNLRQASLGTTHHTHISIPCARPFW